MLGSISHASGATLVVGGGELVGDVVNEAGHFLTVELDAALADGFCYLFARFCTFFGGKENATSSTYCCAAKESG